jgi:NAD(P)-dependent dehydrogenase (short-subunit alcohol dehydrogenase family)
MKRALANAVVVITGGSSGIGHATALAFARCKSRVVIASRSGDALGRVLREIKELGAEGLAVPADVSRFDDVQRIARETVARFGRIDVWINNAAVAEWAFIEEMSPDEMRRVIDVNVLGPMFGVRVALPHLKETSGVIINVASALADRAIPLLSTYSASKAALKSFSDSLRMELRALEADVDVVTILPSSMNTPFYQWGASKLGVRPHPVSVIYPPRLAAEAIVSAAQQPQREIFVGAMGKLLSIAERISPAAMDWYMLQRRNMFRQQYSAIEDDGESNLFRTPDETAIDGPFVDETRNGSVYTKAVELRPRMRRVIAAGAVAAALALLARRVSTRSRAGTAATLPPRLRFLASSGRRR